MVCPSMYVLVVHQHALAGQQLPHRCPLHLKYAQVAAEFVPIIDRLKQSGELRQLAASSARSKSSNNDGVLAKSIAGFTQG
jgi:hypothetical protein